MSEEWHNGYATVNYHLTTCLWQIERTKSAAKLLLVSGWDLNVPTRYLFILSQSRKTQKMNEWTRWGWEISKKNNNYVRQDTHGLSNANIRAGYLHQRVDIVESIRYGIRRRKTNDSRVHIALFFSSWWPPLEHGGCRKRYDDPCQSASMKSKRGKTAER